MNASKALPWCLVLSCVGLGIIGTEPTRGMWRPVAVELATDVALVLPNQCCTWTCWHGFGCCGCTGACACPCNSSQCANCPVVGACRGCAGFFTGADGAAALTDCNWPIQK